MNVKNIKNYPDLWALLLKWDLDSPTTFKADGHTVRLINLQAKIKKLFLICSLDKIMEIL